MLMKTASQFFAKQQGVCVSAVMAAYDRLQAQGLVVARKNQGFFVRDFSSNRRRTRGSGPYLRGCETPRAN